MQMERITGKKSALLGSAYRAGTGASTARNASVGVDNILSIAFRNCADGAFLGASAASDTIVVDNICHENTPPNMIHDDYTPGRTKMQQKSLTFHE